ncbi:hypothetical protein DFH06DRAFT_1145259 [Mycena polygramma]|nr:hypothetical protein DFH06DRAFT_1145259 [Mycena polygramma]
MSTYKSFAVVGGGLIGLPIVAELASRGTSVVLLSRPGSPKQRLRRETAAVAEIFKHYKVEVIRGLQKPLADAAKLAGVKLFVPDELATPTDSEPAGSHNPVAGIGDKAEVAAHEIWQKFEIPEYSFGQDFCAFPPERDVIVMLTIPGFVARILTTLPPSGLENRIFRIQGDRASLSALGPVFNISVEHLDRIPGESGSTGWDETNKVEKTGSDGAGNANTLWSGYKWGSTREVLHL